MAKAVAHWLELQQKLHKRVSQTRYEHCLRVADEAARLANCHGLDEAQAQKAGLLHDIARDLPFAQLHAYAARFGISVGPEEQANPIILHAPVGAALLEQEWRVTDQELLLAVAQHTVAAPQMPPLSQLLYLADIIEPGRRPWLQLAELRALCYQDLTQAMLLALKENFNYLQTCHTFIHPRALAAYDFFQEQLKKQESANQS